MGRGKPDVERQFVKTREAVYANMGELLEKLDAVEKRNPELAKVNVAERQEWQAKIENLTAHRSTSDGSEPG